MAEVVWSANAACELEEIVSFWKAVSQSDRYALKLISKVEKEIYYISKSPYIGHPTTTENVRIRTVLKHYSLIYFIDSDCVVIVRIRDNRRDPNEIFEDLKLEL
jgi:plasmid stabilization system protein ParE